MLGSGDDQLLIANGFRNWAGILLTGMLAVFLMAQTSHAHTDLELQIEELDRRIAADPEGAGLYQARGNLHRRMQAWDKAAADYAVAREVDPEDPAIDWYEGHLWLDAGQPERAEPLLTRFLKTQPGFQPVLYQRALARAAMGRFAAAAGDFEAAAGAAQRPSPVMITNWALSLHMAGQPVAAQDVTEANLLLLPGEVSLLGLAIDLFHAAGDAADAAPHLAQIPKGVARLERWQHRLERQTCIERGPAVQAQACRESALEALEAQAEDAFDTVIAGHE